MKKKTAVVLALLLLISLAGLLPSLISITG